MRTLHLSIRPPEMAICGRDMTVALTFDGVVPSLYVFLPCVSLIPCECISFFPLSFIQVTQASPLVGCRCGPLCAELFCVVSCPMVCEWWSGVGTRLRYGLRTGRLHLLHGWFPLDANASRPPVCRRTYVSRRASACPLTGLRMVPGKL